jgi:3-oxoacyl-[acyl-carrier-protein] synthase II
MSKRVVVTGIGIVCPLGIGREQAWANLLAGKVGIGPIASFDASGFACQIAGQVPEYKVNDFVPKSYRKAAKVMARDIELAVIAADDAMKHAQLQTRAYTESSPVNSLRFGCNIGAGLISAELNELISAMHAARDENKLDLAKWGTDGMTQLTPLWLLKYLPNMLACHVTIVHGLMGPSNTITCADASSHLAIGEAFRTIQRGKADLAICGGAESRINPMGIMRQQLLHRLTDRFNDRPHESVRPFDTAASGTVYGEGGGLLILEELEHARARNATIYAELVGFGATQDTYSVTEPDPAGYCYNRAIARAMVDANVVPSDIDLLVPHAIGHAKGDRAELQALRDIFGVHLSKPAVSTIKSQTGNLAAGSGVDIAAAVLSLHHDVAPPAINTIEQIDGAKFNVSREARPLKLNTALTTTYALGGQNAALVFRKLA